MAQTRSIRTTARRPQARKPDAREEHLRKLTATYAAISKSARPNPHVDPVHDLRTGTRRLQAMVEAILRERNDDSLQESAEKWLDGAQENAPRCGPGARSRRAPQAPAQTGQIRG